MAIVLAEKTYLKTNGISGDKERHFSYKSAKFSKRLSTILKVNGLNRTLKPWKKNWQK